jgi:putative endonuclease
MHTVTTIEKGDEGEEEARRYLANAGFRILETKWRFKRLEVDIIASKPGLIVILEVKTRKNTVFGEPELSVRAKKQGFLIAAAHQYLTTRDIDAETRFDVISVTGEAPDYEVKHLEGAFFPVAK